MYLIFVVLCLHLIWFVGKVVCGQWVREFRNIGVLVLILKCSVFYFFFFYSGCSLFLSVFMNLKVSLPKKEIKKATPWLLASLSSLLLGSPTYYFLNCEIKRTRFAQTAFYFSSIFEKASAPPGSFTKTVHWTVS